MSNQGEKNTEYTHTAMGVVAGFSFQFDVFLNKLLTLQRDEEVSFELWDDVALNSPECIILFQVKHTIKALVSGNAPHLSDRASDLWKAIDVWRKIIVSKDDTAVSSSTAQCNYIRDHSFVLISNKKYEDNILYKLCNDIQSGVVKDNSGIDEVLNKILAKAHPAKGKEEGSESRNTVQSQIEAFKSFDLRLEFLRKLSFASVTFSSLEQDSLEVIAKGFMLPQTAAKEVYNQLKAEVYRDLTHCVQNGAPLKYSFEERYRRFNAIFSSHRIVPLQFHLNEEPYRTDFSDFICIKQLEGIGDVKNTNFEKIAYVASQFLSFKNQYEEAKNDFRITIQEEKDFKDDAIGFWRNQFDYYYADVDDETPETDICKKAKGILREVRNHNINLKQSSLGIPISNGAYYYLSDECLLGWHRNWKELY